MKIGVIGRPWIMLKAQCVGTGLSFGIISEIVSAV